MPHDVLDHDHGVVDHEADGYRKRHKRQVVEAVAEHVKHSERADQRERHGHRRNDRGPEISQEQEDDHHHQRNGQHQGELDVRDGGANGRGPVCGNRDLDCGGHRRLQCWQQRPDAIDGFDDIGARNPLDRENDGGLLAVPAGQQIVFGPLDRRADIADPHRRAVAIGDDEVVIRRRLQQLVVGVQRVGHARAVERALGQIDVGSGDHTTD
ncbi:hypothetical protein SB7C_12215, partial [Staphylococcus epidermidis]